jgi:hypothetical protein
MIALMVLTVSVDPMVELYDRSPGWMRLSWMQYERTCHTGRVGPANGVTV